MIHPSIPMSFVMSAGLIQVETALANKAVKAGDQFILVQDCFRHFDRKKVILGRNHLSLFEMSGAFCFGEIDAGAVIRQMWTFITEDLGVSKSQLWVTYFHGGRVGHSDLPLDQVTHDTWSNLDIPPDRLVGMSEKDNFWIQGGSLKDIEAISRKCGPNTEIFFDNGEEKSCSTACTPGCSCGRFIEIANLLFIRYQLEEQSQKIKELELPFAETVIGNERLAMILQGSPSVFDIESYANLKHFALDKSRKTGLSYRIQQQSLNILVDHLRAILVLIADGAPPPGKGGRAHIMKGLIRGVLTSAILLDLPIELVLNEMIGKVATKFGYSLGHFPKITERICAYFQEDEDRFLKTLAKGEKEVAKYLEANPLKSLSGDQVRYFERGLGIPKLMILNIAENYGVSTRSDTWIRS